MGPVPLLEVVVAADASAVTADLDGARAEVALAPSAPAPGRREVAADAVWRAVLEGVARLLPPGTAAPPGLGVRLAGPDASFAVWDAETLGSPRPVLLPGDERLADGDPAAAAGWLAAHERHTWALVEDGRYALGPIASYLLARATRGTWQAVDRASSCWTPDRLAALPPLARPEPVDGAPLGALTDARVFVGLMVPVVRVG